MADPAAAGLRQARLSRILGWAGRQAGRFVAAVGWFSPRAGGLAGGTRAVVRERWRHGGRGIAWGAGGWSPAFAACTRIAGYRLEEEIGAGGMAVVFRARDERLGRPVALKVLAPGLAEDRRERRQGHTPAHKVRRRPPSSGPDGRG